MDRFRNSDCVIFYNSKVNINQEQGKCEWRKPIFGHKKQTKPGLARPMVVVFLPTVERVLTLSEKLAQFQLGELNL